MKRMTILTALVLAMMPFTAYAADVDVDEPAQEPQEPQQVVSAEAFKFQGVVEANGCTYTWYSENVLPGGGLTELNANGRTVDGSGYVVDGEGYIAVASPDFSEAIGTVVETPFGMGRVYDYCPSGTYDVYTSW